MSQNEPKLDPSKVVPIEFDPNAPCNVPDEIIMEQVRHNTRSGFPQVKPYVPSDNTALLVCGGPTLNETIDELREEVWKGGKIVAVNNAYNWCIEHNFKPAAAIMLDAREFNVRFIEKEVPGCKYLLASQCHPKAFEICKDRDTYIWHAALNEEEVEWLRSYYFGSNNVFPVTLGVTVGIRAISLMRLLGWANQHTFGLDSCWLDNTHHAYSQPENDCDGYRGVWLRPLNRDDKAQRFICSAWHIRQAQDFIELVQERGHLVRIHPHGRGLIAAIINTGAELDLEEEEQ